MHRRWMVTLHDLPDAGRTWEAEVPRKLLEDSLVGSVNALENLCADVHWQVQLDHIGDVYRLTGNWRATMIRQCSRCNASFGCLEEGLTERDFRLEGRAGANEGTASDCEVLSAPGAIDLIDVLREDVWLGRRPDVICSEDCKGLCLRCGYDLNKGACQCGTDESEHPFAILRQMKLDA